MTLCHILPERRGWVNRIMGHLLYPPTILWTLPSANVLAFSIHWSDYVSQVEGSLSRRSSLALRSYWWSNKTAIGRTCLIAGPRSPFIANFRLARRAQKKRYKESLNACHIDHRHWSTLINGHTWHRAMYHTVFFENTRRVNLKKKKMKKQESHYPNEKLWLLRMWSSLPYPSLAWL